MGVLKISRGRQHAPVRAVIYGVEGVGKSTLAAAFPAPLVLDTEDGTRHLDVARVAIPDWKTILLALAELKVDRQGFETIIVDSIDWAERLLAEKVIRDADKKSIEDFGFGKGWVAVAEQLAKFLDALDGLVAVGLNVVLVGHSCVKRTSPPELTDGYDRHELKLSKQGAALVKEWADCLLFATYKSALVEGTDGRKKAVGGRERVLHTERAAAWDAKNRFGLEPTLPMTFDALSPMFSGGPAAESKPQRKTIREQIAEAATLVALGELGDKIDKLESDSKITAEQADEAREMIQARHNEIDPVAEVAT
jgi:hypothetical protein